MKYLKGADIRSRRPRTAAVWGVAREATGCRPEKWPKPNFDSLPATGKLSLWPGFCLERRGPVRCDDLLRSTNANHDADRAETCQKQG